MGAIGRGPVSEEYRQYVKTNPRVLEFRDHIGDGLLHMAVINKSLEWTEFLVSAGLDVCDQKGKMRCAPLHYAAYDGSADIIAVLLDAGAGIEARNRAGNTPLSMAAYGGRLAAVKLLVERGAAPRSRNKAGLTPAGEARRAGHSEIAAFLDGMVAIEARGLDNAESDSAAPDRATDGGQRIRSP